MIEEEKKEKESESSLEPAFPEKKKREIFKCPHKNRKHYAKVIPCFSCLTRICVLIVITGEVGRKKLGYVTIKKNSTTPRVFVKIAT